MYIIGLYFKKMKLIKRFSLALMLMFIAVGCKKLGVAEGVHFANPNLEAVTRDELREPKGPTYGSDLTGLKKLDATGSLNPLPEASVALSTGACNGLKNLPTNT